MPPGIGYPGMTPGFNPGQQPFGPFGLSRMMGALQPQGLLPFQRLPGLLGQGPRNAPASGPQSPGEQQSLLQKIGGGIGQVFGGQNDPNLSAEQNAAARKQAMLMAGLQMLGASGPAPVRPGLGQILASGAMAGQQMGGQARQQQMAEAAAQQAQERIRQAIGNGEVDRDTLQRLYVEMLASGNIEQARSMGEVLKSMPDEGGRGADWMRVTLAGPDGSPVEYLVNRLTGEKREIGAAPRPRRATGSTTPRTYVDENGQPRMGIYDPTTNSMVPIQGASPATASGSEGERKAAAFAQFIPDHVAFIDRLERAPGRLEQAASDRGIREFTDAEQQQLQIAGATMAEAWLRMTTGAAYNEREFQTAYNLFVPQPGDRKETLETKRRNRQRLMDMLNTQSGRLRAPQRPTPNTTAPNAERGDDGQMLGPSGDALDDFLGGSGFNVPGGS